MRKLIFKIKLFFWKLFNREDKLDVKNILCYIYGSEALPSPLDSVEEGALLDELSNGSEYARGKLIEHNLRLVVYIARKFENTNLEMEDLISVGSIGLIKAVKSYNKDKNIKLATYASRCIENEILMQLRKSTRQKRELSMDEPLSFDSEGNELLLSDIIPADNESPSKGLEDSAEKSQLWQAIALLERREQEIMIFRFGLGGNDERTQKEVADIMGISQSYISRIEKKILGKMKKDLEKVQNS